MVSLALKTGNSAPPPRISRMDRDERLLSVGDVAKILGVSPGWVRDHATGRRRPRLTAVRLGKLLRFRLQDVEEFIAECRQTEAAYRMSA